MKYLNKLLQQNKKWAANVCEKNPQFFHDLSAQQSPEYLWIGCSDSRVSANEILGLNPGDVFVHRNVANLVVHSDLNFLSVLQYAVDALKVKHILVCGHYGCGGIKAAIMDESHGLVDNWLRHVQDVGSKHESLLESISDAKKKNDVMCELNAVEQAMNVAKTTVVKDVWSRGQRLMIHVVVYGVSDGILKQIAFGIESLGECDVFYKQAIDCIKNNI